MGTITVTLTGFGLTPATAPANWPAWITYPASAAPNGSRSATLTDAEMLQLVTWAAATNFKQDSQNLNPSIANILIAWVSRFFNNTRLGVQQYFTLPPVPPTPINLV